MWVWPAPPTGHAPSRGAPRASSRGSSPGAACRTRRRRGGCAGSLLHLTLGPAGPLLAPAAAIWLGKRFDTERGSGENVFDRRVFRVGRLLTPAPYQASWPEDARSYRALAFSTSVGPGALDPGVEVFRIDYDLPGNAPPFRRILDELVEVEPGVHLGQALLRRRGGHRRLAWFTLES